MDVRPFEYFKNGFFGTDITMDVTWILQTGDRLSIAVAVFLYSIVKPQRNKCGIKVDY